MKILVVEALAAEGLELLRRHHDVDERLGLPREEIAAILPEYDALVVRSQVKVDAELIAAGTRLVVIGRAGVGVDNVDLEAATRAGIVVVNAPTGNTIAAAELTLALLFGLARRTAAADASMRRGEWKRSQFTGMEVRGKTLGIVGLGKIGQAIAVRARAMQMTVLGSDPFVTHEQAANLGVDLVSFDELVARSDAITVHVPKNKGTTGLINAAVIEQMKPGVLLLNVARGGVIDEQDLADALRSGKVGGAGIDVFNTEPPTGSPLLDAPNTLLTPHLGASTAEAQVAVAEEVAEQILDVLDGRSARYAVNAPLLTPETAQAIAPYLPLAETLGRFVAQLAREAPRTLTLEIAGEPAAHDSSSLVAAVLRGLLEHDTEERVNLVNAGTLAKARGITVVERKTPNAGAFSSLLTLTAEAEGRTVTLAGTVANGEPRLMRLQEHAMDLAPSEFMLISHHMDRPGTVGRVGALLGAVDVNISAMNLARSAPRAEAYMVLALDDDVPPSVVDAIQADDADDRHLGDPPGRRPVTEGPVPRSSAAPARRSSPRVSTRRSSCCATASPSGSSRTASRARARRRCPPRAAARPRSPGSGWRDRTTSPALPVPAGRPLEIVHSPLGRTAETAQAVADAIAAAAAIDGTGPSGVVVRPDPGLLEIGQGEWEGVTHDEISRRWPEVLAGWRRRPWETWAPGGESPGQVQERVRPALAAILERLGRDFPRGTLDRPQVGGYAGVGPAGRPAVVDPRGA